MIDVRIDISKNLASVTYRNRVEPDDARRGAEQLEARLPELRAGFRLLTDLSELDAMDVACAPYIETMMDLCNRQGVELVVRVIPDPKKDIGLNIMSSFHYRRDLRILTFQTLQEASAALEPS